MLGILPMSGFAVRWNNTYKELLPVGENKWLCDYALDAMAYAGVKDIVIVSYPDKIATHVQHFKREKYKRFNISYIMRQGNEMWDALMSAMHVSAHYDRTLFSMPDTVIPLDAFDLSEDDIWFGTFITNEPERFSVFYYNKIICKSEELRGKTLDAWGVIAWTMEIARYWRRSTFPSYDAAFIKAMQNFTHNTCRLEYYYDIQNWQAYKEFIHAERYS